jgi:hypothetical protein
LATQGLRVKDVAGDGNCMFRAICDQLEVRCCFQNSVAMSIGIVPVSKTLQTRLVPIDFLQFSGAD